MLSAIRSRITYVNVVATLVLVFAMTGGALAAKKYLITSTKQISPSVLKSLQGKAGAAGANGAQGSAGPAGPAGPQGAAGVAGAKGDKGDTGEKGKEGATGPTGSPWTAGGTLPPGETETGAWSFGGFATESPQYYYVPISFNIPLPLEIEREQTEYVVFESEVRHETLNGQGKAITPPVANCPTEYPEINEPKAAPGYLCVYEGYRQETTPNKGGFFDTPSLKLGAAASGTSLSFKVPAETGDAVALGSWAVTACDPVAVSGPDVCP